MLQRGYVWEVRKSNESVEVPFYGQVKLEKIDGRDAYKHVPAEYVRAVPYDVPVVGDISNNRPFNEWGYTEVEDNNYNKFLQICKDKKLYIHYCAKKRKNKKRLYNKGY